ncbi:hypothetical protein [Sanyastnella coralliicola]|uniref:hypothetical protein n=1 Tax=Sanyastnella coralliicola TaxID=3069118 RepID=UPI0027B976AB|nr:hypothetical protein [Longitalea sp. SCSIO 12813]
MEALFTEKQKFNQWWLWLVLLAVACIPGYGVYAMFYQAGQVGSEKVSGVTVIFTVGMVLILLLLFLMLKLTTTIDEQGVHIRYFPFVRRSIAWTEVEKAAVIDYGFVGGWGIRLKTKYGTVYNVSGRIGLHLELKDGSQLVVGTQQQDELSQVISELRT